MMTFTTTPGINPPGPTLAELMSNAGQALVRNGKQIFQRRRVLVTEEEAEERHVICKPCEFYYAESERCMSKKCGCLLRIKTRLVAERCPENKWASIKLSD